MTDNRKTQDFYINKYKDKIVIFKLIPLRSSKSAVEERHTTLEVVLTEALIAAFAYNYHGTVGSSCSDLVAGAS